MAKSTIKQPPINITPPRFVKSNPTYYIPSVIGGSGTGGFEGESRPVPSTPGLTKYVAYSYVASGYVTTQQP